MSLDKSGVLNFWDDFEKEFNEWMAIGESILGWFMAYLAYMFLTKLQGPIWPGESRGYINPNCPFRS